MNTSNRAISTAREERIREEDAARTLDGASVGPEADVRDLLAQLDRERAEMTRVTRERDTLHAAVWEHLNAERAESVAYLASINTVTGDSLPSEAEAARDRLDEMKRRSEAALVALVALVGGGQ